MHNAEFDRQVAVLARRQHGVFHTRQAREIGGTSRVLRRRLANGTLLQMAANVWALPGNPATWQRQYKAAELTVPGAAICDRPGALVHGCSGFRVVRPTIAVSRSANARQPLADVRRVTDVPTTVVDGIRVTTLAQTLFDLLACSDMSTVERCVDEALLGRKVTVADLVERAEAMQRIRRANARIWRALVDERADEGWVADESELERLLDAVLRRVPSGVTVLRQATPAWWRAERYRVDAYIPEWALIIEADGRRWHSRATDFDRDRWRDNVAVANGHRVLRFTHTHLTGRPHDVLSIIVASGSHLDSNAA